MDLKDKHDGKFVASVFKALPTLSLDGEESEESMADAKNNLIIAVSRLDTAALMPWELARDLPGTWSKGKAPPSAEALCAFKQRFGRH